MIRPSADLAHAPILELERPVLQDEDRLGLHAYRAQQPEPLLPDARMGSLVGKYVPRLVRLDRERDDDSAALPSDAVRPVNPSERSQARLALVREDPACEPFAVQLRRLLGRLGQGQVDDVVRAARSEALALLGLDGVVRRCDEIRQRSGRAGIADGAERLHGGHPGERTNGQIHRLRT